MKHLIQLRTMVIMGQHHFHLPSEFDVHRLGTLRVEVGTLLIDEAIGSELAKETVYLLKYGCSERPQDFKKGLTIAATSSNA